MAKHSTSFLKAVTTYSSETQQDEYISDVTYYIQVSDDDLERIRNLNERRVMRNIDYFEDKIEEFSNSNNTDFSDPNDVVDLLSHFNFFL